MYRVYECTVNNELGSKYYYLDACDDQYFKLSYYAGSNWIILRDWSLSPEIKLGGVNRLGIAVKGNQFDVYINGEKVDSLQDSTFLMTGDLDFAIEALDKVPALYEIDNVIVLIP